VCPGAVRSLQATAEGPSSTSTTTWGRSPKLAAFSYEARFCLAIVHPVAESDRVLEDGSFVFTRSYGDTGVLVVAHAPALRWISQAAENIPDQLFAHAVPVAIDVVELRGHSEALAIDPYRVLSGTPKPKAGAPTFAHLQQQPDHDSRAAGSSSTSISDT
jgi:hypothetical protein